MEHKHLGIGAASCADADHRDIEFGRNIRREVGGYALKDQQARTGVLNFHGISED